MTTRFIVQVTEDSDEFFWRTVELSETVTLYTILNNPAKADDIIDKVQARVVSQVGRQYILVAMALDPSAGGANYLYAVDNVTKPQWKIGNKM